MDVLVTAAETTHFEMLPYLQCQLYTYVENNTFSPTKEMLTTRRQRFYVAKFSPKSHEEGIQFKYLLKPFFKKQCTAKER